MRTKFLLVLVALTAMGSALVVGPENGSAAATGAENTVTTHDLLNHPNVGSILLDSFSRPVVSYSASNPDGGFIKVLRCSNPDCASGSMPSIVDFEDESLITNSALALDSFDLPVVAYNIEEGSNAHVRVARCTDPTCSSAPSITTIASGLDFFGGTPIAIVLDSNDYPVVSYTDPLDISLRILHCGDPTCSTGNSIESPDPSTVFAAPLAMSLALDAFGFPVVSYTRGDGIRVLHCDDPACAGDESGNISTPDTVANVNLGSTGTTSLVLDASGYPVIAYRNLTVEQGEFTPAEAELRILHCDDPACAGDESGNISIPDGGGGSNVGLGPSLMLDAVGNPVVSYIDATGVIPNDFDGSTLDLKVLQCGNAECTSGNTINTPDTGRLGSSTSLTLVNGKPIVAYSDNSNASNALLILHCGDANCTTKPPPPPTPVLLIHGWRGSCDSMDDVRSHLLDNGYPPERVECFNPLQQNGYRDGCLGRDGAAEVLADYVAGFKTRAGIGQNDKIDIVAHSFGGLVARSYIEYKGGDAHVENLVMLGTPNSGAGFAKVTSLVGSLPLRYCGDGIFGYSEDRALIDMDETVAPSHNATYLLNPPSTAYEVIAGDSGGNIVLDRTGANDCVVTVASARGWVPPPLVWTGFSTNVYSVKHTDDVTFFGVGICGTGDPAVYSDTTCALPRMLNALSGDPTDPCPGGAGVAGVAPAQVSPPLVLSGTGAFATAGSDAYSSALDTSVTGAAFELAWVDDTSDLHLEVRRPGGALVSGGDADVTYLAPQTGIDGVVREAYSIDAPASGKWTVDVVADSVAVEGAAYQVLGTAASPVGIELSADAGSYETSNPITLQAKVMDGAVAVTGASVSVDVTRPDASTTTFTLFDDGLSGDGAANDGVYGGTYSDTSGCGLYTFNVTATGSASGGAFTRYALANIAVSAEGDVVGDLCETDDDQDGCTDAVEFGQDETLGGLRDPLNPYDFYDVLGPGAALPVDGVIDLPNDILGVIHHFSPGGAPPYDVQFDRGPATAAAGGGPNPWNMTAPDGVIDLPNDILGVILQFNHDCR